MKKVIMLATASLLFAGMYAAIGNKGNSEFLTKAIMTKEEFFAKLAKDPKHSFLLQYSEADRRASKKRMWNEEQGYQEEFKKKMKVLLKGKLKKGIDDIKKAKNYKELRIKEMEALPRKRYMPGIPGMAVRGRYVPAVFPKRIPDIGSEAKINLEVEAIIHKAAEERLAELKADVNFQEPKTGRTRLHVAIEKGDLAEVKKLIGRGANPAISYDCFSPDRGRLCTIGSPGFVAEKIHYDLTVLLDLTNKVLKPLFSIKKISIKKIREQYRDMWKSKKMTEHYKSGRSREFIWKMKLYKDSLERIRLLAKDMIFEEDKKKRQGAAKKHKKFIGSQISLYKEIVEELK